MPPPHSMVLRDGPSLKPWRALPRRSARMFVSSSLRCSAFMRLSPALYRPWLPVAILAHVATRSIPADKPESVMVDLAGRLVNWKRLGTAESLPLTSCAARLTSCRAAHEVSGNGWARRNRYRLLRARLG